MTEKTALNQDAKIGIVLLAAGASERMGTPKQLLKINGISLIRHAVENALDCGCGPVVVVLGANAHLIAPELDGLPIQIVTNQEWNSGMTSSIRCGLSALLAAHRDTESVILFLADQPNVTGTSLRKLTTAHAQCNSQLVAASYSGQIGTPALFSRAYFDRLLQVQEQGGAKTILKQNASRVLSIEFPEAVFDLDTPQDFADFAQGKAVS